MEKKMSDITLRRKSLILLSKFYQYILNAYGNKSEVTLMCFDDIITLWTSIETIYDLEISTYTYDSVKSIFDSYINENVTFNPRHLDLLKDVTDLEIIRYFFNNFLSNVFGMRNKRSCKKRKKHD